MRLILLGPPGSGKGTQANRLRDKFNVPKISTGDILRSSVQENSELGREAKRFMDNGELVPDEVVVDLIKERIQQPDCTSGYVLDGFPRTLVQAEKLDEMLSAVGEKLDVVVDLEVDHEEILVRLTGRSTCRDCGAMFHDTCNPPEQEGICDQCGGLLYQRQDDNRETILKRLEIYERETAPLKEYYRERNLLKTAQGTGSMEDIFNRVCAMVS
jgi:adenylate kinase